MKQSERLIKLVNLFSEFHGKPLNTHRKALYEAIQKAIKEYELTRRDNNKTVELKWHPEPSLAPEILIYVDNNNNIGICDDSLWRTIEGIHEAEQEKLAYMRDVKEGFYY